MTATASPPLAPVPEPPPPSTPGRRPRRARQDPSIPAGHLLLAEITLGALTCAAVFGFCRIFASWSFLAPLLVVAVTAHVTVAWCRRRGISLPVAFAISTVEWVLVVTWLFFVDTTFALIPTPDTISTARLELDRSWSAFQEIVAPAPVQTGFLLAAAVAVAGGAFLADWAAFRLWSAREALVPSVTLFVFATLLADERHRVVSAVVMIAATIAFLLAHRVVSLERSEGWVTTGRAAAGRSLLLAGSVLAVVAVVAGSLVAPHLPGVDEEAIVDWRNQDGADNARMLTSPLVDIRTRLVDTSNTPLFTVEADAAAYWRMASLDVFDGTQWELSATTDEVASGFLEVDRLAAGQGDPLYQRYTMQDLETFWWPAAFQAVEFRPGDGELVRHDLETATLIGDDATGEGTTYEVWSTAPDHSPEVLRSADQAVPDAIEHALALPDDFSELAESEARAATAGATSNFDRAIRLQEYFRETGGFTYSTDITGGQSTDAIDEFLQNRVGYCEQFAGTFAAMARSLGIPARVAVGYTWGDEDPATGTFQVRGRNAHAWPEVYLGRYGWVPFEPTPGRGNPAAEGYTGVEGDQETEQVEGTTTTTTTVPEGGSTTTTLPAGVEESAAAAAAAGRDDAGDLLRSMAQVAGLVLIAAVAYVLTVPGSLALRRRRRRARAAGSPSARVGLAWTEATEALAATGVRARRDETHTELAGRARATLPATGEAMARLSSTADAAAYGPTPSAADGTTAEQAAAEVDRVVEASLGRAGRLRRRLDPRPLWAGRAHRHRTR